MKNKISIIVPVYNVEAYLVKCVESLIHQTYKNIEILLIDDGSLDSSGTICDDLANKYSSVRVIHKENGGLSSARNVGVEGATGEYVAFVDSDDYIEEDMLELLYNNLTKYDCDVSACGYTLVYNDKNVLIANGDEVRIYTGEESLAKGMLVHDLGLIFCNKLFKKTLFKNIEFPLGQAFEDINTIYKIFAKSERVVYQPVSKYNYVQRSDSINGLNFKTKKFNRKNYDLYHASMEVYSFVKKKYPSILSSVSVGCANYNLRVINQMILFSCIDREVVSKTKQILKVKDIMKSEWGIGKKVQLLLFCCSFPTYCFLVKFIFFIRGVRSWKRK